MHKKPTKRTKSNEPKFCQQRKSNNHSQWKILSFWITHHIIINEWRLDVVNISNLLFINIFYCDLLVASDGKIEHKWKEFKAFCSDIYIYIHSAGKQFPYVTLAMSQLKMMVWIISHNIISLCQLKYKSLWAHKMAAVRCAWNHMQNVKWSKFSKTTIALAF